MIQLLGESQLLQGDSFLQMIVHIFESKSVNILCLAINAIRVKRYELSLFCVASAHGLGTAALSAKEPEALPFCAIAYALTGIFGSLLCSVPAVRQSLLAVVG